MDLPLALQQDISPITVQKTFPSTIDLFCFNKFAIQLYFITENEVSKLDTISKDLLLKFLGMVEVFLTNHH